MTDTPPIDVELDEHPPGAVGPANSGAWIDPALLKIISSWRAN